MSRAHGKHTQRRPELSPGEVREFGIDERDIPGGGTHLVNPVTVQQKVSAPEKLGQFRGMMAHGVPPEGMHHERNAPGKAYQPGYEHDRRQARPVPVPVVIVEEGAGSRPLKVVATRHFQAPAIGQEPANVCGEDIRRSAVRVLNTDSSHNAWIGQLSDLAFDAANSKVVGGAILPKSMTSYLTLEHQGPLYIVSDDSGTPVISVILETAVPGAG